MVVVNSNESSTTFWFAYILIIVSPVPVIHKLMVLPNVLLVQSN